MENIRIQSENKENASNKTMYKTPRFQVLGSLSELTQASGSVNNEQNPGQTHKHT